jgi:dihydroorotate dehydrogenase
MWPLVRAVLFLLDAEHAHELTIGALSVAPRAWGGLFGALVGAVPARPSRPFGVELANPVGLAAGLDKDGRAALFWPALGFGFVEVGTVTAHPQPGNERPRLFRLPEDRALINRMGFNNQGSQALADRLRALKDAGRWPRVPLGCNLGKSKVTPNEDAPQDYVTSVTRLRGLADWFTINVSSPNTPGLRDLQDKDALGRLLPAVRAAAGDTPLLLKLAPDLEDEAIAAAVELAVEHGFSGIVATNTTITRPGLRRDPGQAGGLSGAPLRPLARAKIAAALTAANGRIPVVGAGGIAEPEHARDLLALGCCAVQLYTALIYEGPTLPARLVRAI